MMFSLRLTGQERKSFTLTPPLSHIRERESKRNFFPFALSNL